MAQNIEIANAQYNDVPSIEVPKQGGGTASFVDTTDADAIAGDILQGKTAYVNGVKLTGTGSGGGYNYGFTLVDTVQLSVYATKKFVNQSQTVGNTISISNSVNNWFIVKGQIQKNKIYLCLTHHTSTDLSFVVTDSSDKVVYHSYGQGVTYSITNLINKVYILDTSSITQEEIYLYYTMGNKTQNYFNLNTVDFAWSDTVGGLPVFTVEIDPDYNCFAKKTLIY